MQDIQEVEISIEHAQEMANKKKQLDRLLNNRDFKKIITEGYCKDEAVRLVSLSAENQPHINKEDIMDQIKAISHFQQFIRNTLLMGETAERELAELNEAADELRGQEA